jgi:RHS repeat-associated protein
MLSVEANRGNQEPVREGSYGRFLYNRFRYYDPTTGRYVSADPIGQWGGVNVYRYVFNDPLNWIDFLGLDRYSFFAKGPDEGAFRNRAEQGAGPSNTEGFGTGDDLVSDFSASPDITRADVHCHGWEAGVIGDGTDVGFYVDSYAGGATPSAASVSDFVAAVKSGAIDLEPNAELVFFGCNSDQLAKELSAALDAAGRGDVTVTGASGSVYPLSPETGAGVDGGGSFNRYRGGKPVGSSKTRSYK